MTDTPNLPAVLADPGLAVIDVSGADAVNFLHGQLSHDVAELPAGRSRLAAYCTPKGRILGLLRVWRNGTGCSALVEAELADVLARRLAMFVLRAQAKVAVRTGTVVAGLLGPGLETLLARSGLPCPAAPGDVCEHGDVTLLALPGAFPRVAMAGPAAAVGAALAALNVPPAETETWMKADVTAGLARVTATTREQFLPHHLNLDLTDGLSFRKGCYPGQEIVARMHYRGRPTRRMLRLAADVTGLPGAGSTLHDASGAQAVGEVVSATHAPDGIELLAVVQISALERPLHLGTPGGPTLRTLSLPYTVPELSAPRPPPAGPPA